MRPPSGSVRKKVGTLPVSGCLAKTVRGADGLVYPGRTVENHCQIVGEVAAELLQRKSSWLTGAIFPGGTELVCASHDLGKVSPTFQAKLYRALSDGTETPTALDGVDPSMEKGWGGHAGVSLATGEALGLDPYVCSIIGQHHGFYPELGGKRANAEVFGGEEWQAERERLVASLKRLLNTDYPKIPNDAYALAIAGLTTVADWIGSGEFFEDPGADWRENVSKSVDNAGFLPLNVVNGLSFSDVFGFAPRPAQQSLIDTVTGPGVYVLEAPMGLGKTEAALYCAYRLLSQGQAEGVYFALPTQLTSNKIWSRMNGFLHRILQPEDAYRKALLLHGAAWMVDTEMGEEGRPGQDWFNASKRGILAPFAVGTIDQALMSVMNVKHGFIRAFGLAGKVVILDEVHSYDAYTGTLLEELIRLLRQLKCTVIVLSATLTADRRTEFLQAQSQSEAYPLISGLAEGEVEAVEETPEPPENQSVRLSIIARDDEALREAINRAQEGQQVLWIENTVDEAQQVYRRLATAGGEIEIGLLHSRFTSVDREFNETRWVNLFGKQGHNDRQVMGRVLVGTQVVEQSIDIDADFLVTRFAPTDMLLQRMGRLWRHHETPRPASAVREAWLLAPTLSDALQQPIQAFGKSAFVYSPYVLCRSLEQWQVLSHCGLPSDIRGLIEATYVDREEDGQWQALYHELLNGSDRRRGVRALKQLARLGLSRQAKTISDNQAPTRYSDREQVDVLLLKDIELDAHGATVTLLDGECIELLENPAKLNRKSWKTLSAKLNQFIVSVPPERAPAEVSIDAVAWLRPYLFVGTSQDTKSRVRIGLVNTTKEIMSTSGMACNTYGSLRYSSVLGYQAIKG